MYVISYDVAAVVILATIIYTLFTKYTNRTKALFYAEISKRKN